MKRLAALKQSRNQQAVKESLAAIKSAGKDGKNLMPEFINASRHYATLGEMIGELKEVFGIYEETAVF